MQLLLFVTLMGTASALFEDQAFKFDWKQSFIGAWFLFFSLQRYEISMFHSGHVTHAGFFSSSKASVFVVATESHVVMIHLTALQGYKNSHGLLLSGGRH